MKKYIIITVIVIITLAGTFLYLQNKKTQSIKPSNNAIANTEQRPKNSLDKNQHSLTEPSSSWVIVNKKNAIPLTYAPDLVVPDIKLRLNQAEEQMQISRTAEPAFKEMFQNAKNDGITLVFGSGYRSSVLQKQFYDSYKVRDGQDAADTYSARPGHSEHQTGLSADITSPGGECHLEICWEDTPEGKWINNNAYKYGFILRYPKDKQTITGYQYEPWHVRFVGKELSDEIHNTGQTLEEFFNLPHAPNYD